MSDPRPYLERIRTIARIEGDRVGKSRRIAALIRDAGRYRWVGIYDVAAGGVSVVAWSGSRYLATLGGTRSEIVVPVLGLLDEGVVRGLIDVESDGVDAFGDGDRRLLEEVAAALRSLWK